MSLLSPSDLVDSPVGGPRPRPKSDSTLLEHSQSYVRPELLSSWPPKCAYVVDEILKTEIDYLKALEDIIEGYKNPLAGRLRMTNEGQRIVQTIFGNVEDIHALHRTLLAQLQAHENEPQEFGQVFTVSEKKFHVYTSYCTSYEAAITTLDNLLKQSKDIEQFILSCQRQLGHPLPLNSQLIKPVQRIMRYHMLLDGLVCKFDPNLVGHTSLDHAHKAMARIAGHVNEMKKLRENDLRAQDIQNYLSGWSNSLSAYGRLILESTCHVGKRGVKRQVILFEKLLLILKKKDVKRYNYKGHVLTEDLCIDKSTSSNPSSTFKVFSRGHTHQMFLIQAANNTVQSQWVTAITSLLESLAELRKQEEAKFEKFLKQAPHTTTRKRPQTVNEEPRYRFGSSQSRRLIGPRKRPRPDVREMFPEEEEAGVQLVSVTKATSDPVHSSTDAQQAESSLKYVRITDQSELENDSNLLNMSQRGMKKSKSSDSVLSLGDVELADVEGMAVGVVNEGVEETDSPPPSAVDESPTKKSSNLSRKAAIKVKKTSVTPSSSCQSIIRIRAQEARRSASSEAQMDEDMELGHQSGDEESELSLLLLGSPQTSLNPSSSPARETSQEYDSVYHSGMAAGGPPPPPMAANGEYQIEIEDLSPMDKEPSDVGSGRVYDSGVGEMEESMRQGAVLSSNGEIPLDEGGDGVQGVTSDDIMILEDSSDSEDEDEDEAPPLPTSAPPPPLSPPPDLVTMGMVGVQVEYIPLENGEQSTEQTGAVSSTGPSDDPKEKSLSGGELTNFFKELRRGESPSSPDQSHDSAEGDGAYQFKSRPAELYATLPRKPRPKPMLPKQTIPTEPRPHNLNLSQSTHYLSRSAARRADGFSRLLEFTRQQRNTPEMSPARQLSASGGYDVTQSLPVGGGSPVRSLDYVLENEGGDKMAGIAEKGSSPLPSMQLKESSEDVSDLKPSSLKETEQSSESVTTTETQQLSQSSDNDRKKEVQKSTQSEPTTDNEATNSSYTIEQTSSQATASSEGTKTVESSDEILDTMDDSPPTPPTEPPPSLLYVNEEASLNTVTTYMDSEIGQVTSSKESQRATHPATGEIETSSSQDIEQKPPTFIQLAEDSTTKTGDMQNLELERTVTEDTKDVEDSKMTKDLVADKSAASNDPAPLTELKPRAQVATSELAEPVSTAVDEKIVQDGSSVQDSKDQASKGSGNNLETESIEQPSKPNKDTELDQEQSTVASTKDSSVTAEQKTTEFESELRKRLIKTPTKSDTEQSSVPSATQAETTSQEVTTSEREHVPASTQARGQSANTAGWFSTLIGRWLPRHWRSGLFVLSVVAVSSLLLYAGISYSNMLGGTQRSG